MFVCVRKAINGRCLVALPFGVKLIDLDSVNFQLKNKIDRYLARIGWLTLTREVRRFLVNLPRGF